MRQIVMILHADNLAYPATLRGLRGCDIAQPDVTHETLTLEVGQNAERRFDRPFGRSMRVEHAAKIDHVEHIEDEIAEVIVDRLGELGRGESGNPRSIRAAP